jgi:hypothetical protein
LAARATDNAQTLSKKNDAISNLSKKRDTQEFEIKGLDLDIEGLNLVIESLDSTLSTK